ncbi:YdeI/OmpD-associated family protein [Microbacterium lushaniae]|uniref:YdeI/OmpD-associated family protein n=1 Tax=Microbacterium lushaniae TaxID=2614639 RepID=A0A5J6L6X9_9MICO|nr:YdeI/OmpD-associated family protein [Microbacterium lushaniae]QEW04190.1 YdeI/OmpD-associated family protein [Microbacterium lushaniae]
MLTRPRYPLPPDIAQLLDERELRADYDARPAYQRNDYVGWIGRAKTAATRTRRVEVMLTELAEGGVYMGMQHAPSRKSS